MNIRALLPGLVFLTALCLPFSAALGQTGNKTPDPSLETATYTATPGGDRLFYFTYPGTGQDNIEVPDPEHGALVTEDGAVVDPNDIDPRGEKGPPLPAGSVRCALYRGSYLLGGGIPGPLGRLLPAGHVVYPPISRKPFEAWPDASWTLPKTYGSKQALLDAAGHPIHMRTLFFDQYDGISMLTCIKGGSAPSDAEMNDSLGAVGQVKVAPPGTIAVAKTALMNTLRSWWSALSATTSDGATPNVANQKIEGDARSARQVETDADAGAGGDKTLPPGGVPAN